MSRQLTFMMSDFRMFIQGPYPNPKATERQYRRFHRQINHLDIMSSRSRDGHLVCISHWATRKLVSRVVNKNSRGHCISKHSGPNPKCFIFSGDDVMS